MEDHDSTTSLATRYCGLVAINSGIWLKTLPKLSPSPSEANAEVATSPAWNVSCYPPVTPVCPSAVG